MLCLVCIPEGADTDILHAEGVAGGTRGEPAALTCGKAVKGPGRREAAGA